MASIFRTDSTVNALDLLEQIVDGPIPKVGARNHHGTLWISVLPRVIIFHAQKTLSLKFGAILYDEVFTMRRP